MSVNVKLTRGLLQSANHPTIVLKTKKAYSNTRQERKMADLESNSKVPHTKHYVTQFPDHVLYPLIAQVQ